MRRRLATARCLGISALRGRRRISHFSQHYSLKNRVFSNIRLSSSYAQVIVSTWHPNILPFAPTPVLSLLRVTAHARFSCLIAFCSSHEPAHLETSTAYLIKCRSVSGVLNHCALIDLDASRMMALPPPRGCLVSHANRFSSRIPVLRYSQSLFSFSFSLQVPDMASTAAKFCSSNNSIGRSARLGRSV